MSNPLMASTASSQSFLKQPMGEIAPVWQYWKLCQISLKSEIVGYEYRVIPAAQEFFQKHLEDFSNSDAAKNRDIQAILISYFHSKKGSVDAATRANAGLCLRCNVSYPILKACQKIDNLFGGDKSFTYRDLLPYVLNDDGQAAIILDSDRKTQLVLNDRGQASTTTYKYFTVEVLRTFNSESKSSMSLANWAYLQTKQNQDLKYFLSEFGWKNLSDWALLNRARPKQIERLSERDRILVEVFHAVYRRDRRQQQQKVTKKSPDPSSEQLQEMLTHLQKQNIVMTPIELMKGLKQLATQLRQYDIWSYREPLEIHDPDTGSDVLRPDLPHDSFNELDLEQRELMDFLHQELRLALTQSILQEIPSRITELQKSRKYANFAQKFIPGLKLYYCQSLSLKEIAPALGMTSWDQARRILNPGELLNKIRTLTGQKFLDKILKKAQSMGLTQIPPEPDYLKTIVELTEAFADREVFQAAVEEIRAGKNREMNSLYAQQLRVYFEQHP
ncbi:hypothetical protein [Microseira wollei]|uniref:Uncharacterized protein n=1 Tax=Microseira wollei NIES-4236 TaxID=2530354 RepID=A0AAV3X3H7_9CYAN|nr:hypothetical protein [Microseira wollei]GET35716.1 hypothetical protein MiSe_04610 [Microseira wollei NIES-4236]